MRHEIMRDTVVGVIQQNFHRSSAILQSARFAAREAREIESARANSSPWCLTVRKRSFGCYPSAHCTPGWQGGKEGLTPERPKQRTARKLFSLRAARWTVWD